MGLDGTDSASARLSVTTDLPWLVRGWCRLVTRPLLLVDNTYHEVSWGAPTATTTIGVDAGEHRAQFKVRFRGTRNYGASSRPLLIGVGERDTIHLLARVPIVNGHPPTLREHSPDDRANR